MEILMVLVRREKNFQLHLKKLVPQDIWSEYNFFFRYSRWVMRNFYPFLFVFIKKVGYKFLRYQVQSQENSLIYYTVFAISKMAKNEFYNVDSRWNFFS